MALWAREELGIDLGRKILDEAESAPNLEEVLQPLWKNGYAVLEGLGSHGLADEAVEEANALWENGKFHQPPREVLEGLLGDTGSAWCMELGSPHDEAPKGQEVLRQLDEGMSALGFRIGEFSKGFLGMELEGRTVAVLHRARSTLDKANPRITDPQEADEYLNLFQWKKVKLLYYLGPTKAMVHFIPVASQVAAQEFPAATLDVMSNCVIVLRGDLYRCRLDPKIAAPGITLEIDFLARRWQSQQGWYQDLVRAPQSLLAWYMSHYHTIVENHVSENLPEDFLKMARMSCYSSSCRAVSIRAMDFRLPGGLEQDLGLGWALIRGACCISEIPKSRWDLEQYFDEDMAAAESGKMYVRHLGLITGSDVENVVQSADEEDLEHVGILKSANAALTKGGIDRFEMRTASVGVFLGIASGDSASQFQVVSGDVLRGRSYQARPESSVSKQLEVTGPSMTVDADDASGQVAVDTAYMYLRNNACSPYAITGCARLLHSPLQVVAQCLRRTLSRSGECRVFDASCDGEVLGEGVATLVLALHSSPAEEDDDNQTSVRPRAVIVGSAMSSEGMEASASAKSTSAVLQRALRPHDLSGALIDAFEADAKGVSATADLQEFEMLQKVAVSEEAKPPAAMVRSSKASFGNAGSAAGVSAIVKTCLLLELGCHSPCIRINQLISKMRFATGNADEAGETEDDAGGGRVCIPTEMVEARQQGQFVGVSSFGATGTRVHTVLLGFSQRGPREKLRPGEAEKVNWDDWA
mmetsp:Transcript_52176/g.124346  ORF Transcript_52176/g.124346 Transcript_52176/m.124346 type:complete len:756 (+) Transcript_52176:132-2399(+)|eukprot:CAMPEP_0178405364 /NCGR_PEP_ID=MMETSP0689_2-20121128/18360_1 /TAXON_ID=160604 /ORGANISM="Amphidinium massartii, Strain CS-259" /LENGTH=755 /DNA_ID=CAMNT_0020026375 /DNA_START=32 /DNA_END=2299 /DNA_ORIENTATION=-